MISFTKIKWIAGLSAVFLLIVATGRTNIHNFNKVRNAIEGIYEDRLIVKGLIFDISSMLHSKEIAWAYGDDEFYQIVNASIDEQIGNRITAFKLTELTDQEAKALDRLEANITLLQEAESELGLSSELDLTADEIQRLRAVMANIKAHLKTLAEIQISEGRRKLRVSDRAVDEMNWVAQIETYMLALVALAAIAAVLFRSKNET